MRRVPLEDVSLRMLMFWLGFLLAPRVLLLPTAAATGTRAPSNCSVSVRGYSWPGSAPGSHLPHAKTEAACCAACGQAQACRTWTLHPSNGCWLHGARTAHPVAVRCGDGDSCVSGTPDGTALPSKIPPAPAPPRPRPRPAKLATPSEPHLRFHEDNVGAISHFGMQTFAPKRERSAHQFASKFPPTAFTPRELNVDQWVSAAASFGAKYYVLVADHFSGFSLYPTAAHSYSIAHSPQCPSKNIIADFVVSCLKHGLRPAFYYSVHENWYYNVSSFNLTDPGKQRAFEDMAMQQLAEIIQIFGRSGADVAEIWFDAGVRQSNAFVQRVNDFVAKELPSATCHSCGNMPDVHAVSWMGNEETVMSYPMWNANTDTLDFTGSGGKSFGIPDGTRWVPAHCDAVLRRHFWFWAENYNSTSNLNTPEQLLAMHLTSVGRGCNMILDMSPTRTGLLQENDVATYAAFGAGQHKLYNASLLCQTPGGIDTASQYHGANVVELELPRAITRGAIELRENLTDGQSISNYEVEHFNGNTWSTLPLYNEGCQTIGNRRIQYFTNTTVQNKIRVTMDTLQLASGDKAPPHLRSMKVMDWSNSELDGLLTSILTVK